MSSSTPKPVIQHYLVGVDGSPQSQQAFQYALSLGPPGGSVLFLVAAIHSPLIVMSEPDERAALIEQERLRLSQCTSEMAEQATFLNKIVHTIVEVGEPLSVLLSYARQHRVDHIIVGHRSKGALEQLMLGSVAKGVVDGAQCTVTVIR